MNIIVKNTNELLYPKLKVIQTLKSIKGKYQEIKLIYNSFTGEIVPFPNQLKDGEFSYIILLKIDVDNKKDNEFLYSPLPIKNKVFRIKANKEVYDETFGSLNGDLVIKRSLENVNKIYKNENLLIKYRKLSPKDWLIIKKRILEMDNEFFGDMDSEDNLDYNKMFNTPNMIAYAAELNDKLEGFIIGVPAKSIKNEFRDEKGNFLVYSDKISDDSLYVASLDVYPLSQDKGIGTNLILLLVKEAKEKGFKSISAHMTQKASKCFKGNKLSNKICKNYYDTGEDYTFINIPI